MPAKTFFLNIREVFYQTFFKLFSGLVGEGDGQRALTGFKLLANARDAKGKRVRLAGAGPCDDQQVSHIVSNRP